MIAKMAAGTEIGRLLVWRAGWLKNQGLRNTRETSLAKWHATEHAVQSALDAIQVHGANGYSNEFPVERYLRNSKAAVIYEGTSQLHTLIQADYALGYREDRPLRCEPWPAQGWERRRPRDRGRPAVAVAPQRWTTASWRPCARPRRDVRRAAMRRAPGRASPPRRSLRAADPAQVAPAPARAPGSRDRASSTSLLGGGRAAFPRWRPRRASATCSAGPARGSRLRRSAFGAFRKLLTFLAYADPGPPDGAEPAATSRSATSRSTRR